jgi:hypothetical protein|tara:strand:- start:1623 stop:1823 length:201 start_codon:yes stop_codon:yes gene_type:complete
MDEFPNMPFNYSVSWQQSYPAANFNFAPTVNVEMAVIEAIDRLVDSGLTHPLADAIIKSLVNNFKE